MERLSYSPLSAARVSSPPYLPHYRPDLKGGGEKETAKGGRGGLTMEGGKEKASVVRKRTKETRITVNPASYHPPSAIEQPPPPTTTYVHPLRGGDSEEEEPLPLPSHIPPVLLLLPLAPGLAGLRWPPPPPPSYYLSLPSHLPGLTFLPVRRGGIHHGTMWKKHDDRCS